MPQQLIGSTWQVGEGAAFVSRNPLSLATVWQGAAASAAQLDAAVAAARAAFFSWSEAPRQARCEVLRRFASLLQADAAALAACIGQETGKPRWEALSEVASMVAKVELAIRAQAERAGSRSTEAGGVHSVLRHRAHGVLAVLGPYNFPGHLPNGHIVPALLAGNCVVFKPSELAPAVAVHTLRLWQAAGLPAGVLNLVQGGGETGAQLARHRGIDGLLFTGSYAVGQRLHQLFAATPHKILALEMGGNNALLADAYGELRAAVFTVLQSAFLSAGQRCTCARRLIVPQGAAGDALIVAVVAAAQRLRVGAWDAEPAPFMGALITPGAAQRLLDAQQALLERGAQALLPLRSLAAGTGLVSPGLIDVSALGEVGDEEHFGPLLQVQRCADFSAALELANATRYGLAAGLISEDPARFEHCRRALRVGILNWNRPLTGASSAAPFGGVGASGNHRPSAWYAADYCAWPVAGMEAAQAELPAQLPPGMEIPESEQA